MGVTEVVRGRDLLASTACQLRLFDALGARSPRYGHVPLLTNETGRRLSKRERDLDAGALRQRFTPRRSAAESPACSACSTGRSPPPRAS